MDAETRKTLNEQLDAMWETINKDDTTYDDTTAKLLRAKDETIERLNTAINVAESRAEDYERQAMNWESRAKMLAARLQNIYDKHEIPAISNLRSSLTSFFRMIGVAETDIRKIMDTNTPPNEIYDIAVAYMRGHTTPKRTWIKEG